MRIESRDKFYVNGVSCEDVGLYCDTLPVIPMGQMRYTDWTVGADEDRSAPDWTFEDIDYTITAYVFMPESFDDTAIHEFLVDAKTLQLSTIPGKYFKVHHIVADVSGDYDNKRLRYTFRFTLSPFRYNTENPEISLSSGDVLSVSGNRYSKPLFKITLPDTYLFQQFIVLTVNGQSITVNLPNNSTVFVDSDREIVYSGNTLLRDSVIGKYPLFSVGDNVVEWVTSGIVGVSVFKNERWY